MYRIEDPLCLLKNPPSKSGFKNQVKLKLLDYWQGHLRDQASNLVSISHLHLEFYSLSRPHPVWATCLGNPFECSKALVLSLMMTGRYPTDYLSRRWNPGNRTGYCKASTCEETLGTLEHILLFCPELEPTRCRMRQMMIKKSSQCNILYLLILGVLIAPPAYLYQFLLDPLGLPQFRQLVSTGGSAYLNLIFYMTRTYVFFIHRQYLMSRNKWPNINPN